jgi:hypothetical protein
MKPGKKLASVTIALSLISAIGVMACSSDDASKLRRDTDGDGAGADAGNTDPVIAPSGGSVRAPYQMKTSKEIASVIAACFGGTGITVIAESMLQTPANPAGFLSARQFGVGDDVVSGEAFIIDGDSSVERVGVRNASLSLPILAALQDIGNVVGENCAAQLATNPLCNCATREQAHSMLARCLPAIAPSKYEGLEAGFATSCGSNPATAIASLVASTAFGAR